MSTIASSIEGKKWAFNAREINRSELTPLEASKLLVPTLPSGVDPTHMQLSYGRIAIPNLVASLVNGGTTKQQKSLVFLANLLHDPLKISQALEKGVISILIDLKSSSDLTIRQKSTECMSILASTYLITLDHAIGRAQLIELDALMSLSLLFQDDCDFVRYNVHDTIKKCSNVEAGVQNILKNGILPSLVSKLPEERMDIQIMILDTLYMCIRLGKEPFMPKQILDCDALKVFTMILRNEMVSDTKVAAANCIMMLCFYKVAKVLATKGETLGILIELLADSKSEVRAAAAGALMSITIDCEAKKLMVRDNAVSTLMDLLDDTNDSVLLNVIKTITNVAEDFRGRFQLHSCVKKLEKFMLSSSNQQLQDASKRAIQVITWRP